MTRRRRSNGAGARATPWRAAAALALGLGGCLGPTVDPALEDAWREHLASAERADDGGVERRRALVLELVADGRVLGPGAAYRAACMLVTSNRVETLELARDLAFTAASGDGARRALPVAARAVDRILIRRREPQRYGTQVVFDAQLRRWRLASFDESTTDEERRSMFVPELAKLHARAERMNGS